MSKPGITVGNILINGNGAENHGTSYKSETAHVHPRGVIEPH